MTAHKAICLTDLSQCTPRQAILGKSAPSCWRAVPYDLGEIQGTLLVAGPESEAAPVTLSLKANGWHAIHLGLWPQYGLGEEPLVEGFRRRNGPRCLPPAGR